MYQAHQRKLKRVRLAKGQNQNKECQPSRRVGGTGLGGPGNWFLEGCISERRMPPQVLTNAGHWHAALHDRTRWRCRKEHDSERHRARDQKQQQWS